MADQFPSRIKTQQAENASAASRAARVWSRTPVVVVTTRASAGPAAA